MKNLLILKYDSFAVSLLSIIYGINIIIFPQLLDTGETYEILSTILSSITFGSIFIILGSLKIIGIFKNMPKLRAFAISGLISVWMLFFICVAFSGIVNSVWTLSLAMVIFSFGVVVKEWFR